MIEFLVIVLIFLGLFFMTVGSLGIVRMPDLFMRASATTKAATLGVAFFMGAVTLYFDDLGTTSKAVAIIFFVSLTAPVAAHMIGRSAYFDGVPLWEKSIIDELKGRYDLETQKLSNIDNK